MITKRIVLEVDLESEGADENGLMQGYLKRCGANPEMKLPWGSMHAIRVLESDAAAPSKLTGVIAPSKAPEGKVYKDLVVRVLMDEGREWPDDVLHDLVREAVNKLFLETKAEVTILGPATPPPSPATGEEMRKVSKLFVPFEDAEHWVNGLITDKQFARVLGSSRMGQLQELPTPEPKKESDSNE